MARSITTVIAELERAVAELKAAFETSTGPAAAPAQKGRKAKTIAASPATDKRAPARKAPSPKRVLQARYMTALRKLSKTKAAKVRKLRDAQGVEAALALAATMGA